MGVTSERKGVYRLLRMTAIYDLVQKVIGSDRGANTFVAEYIKPFTGARILDIGAGTGLIVSRLGQVEYLGIEPNPTYVDDFNAQYASEAARLVAGTTNDIEVSPNSYDIVLISAVLHHVNDDLSRAILRYAADAVTDDGRVVLLDPVLHPGQGLISRQLVSRDRGKHVRKDSDYKALFNEVGLQPTFDLRTDLNRFPYSHIITVATKS